MNFIQLGLQEFICALFLGYPPLHLGIVASFMSLELELESNDLGLDRVEGEASGCPTNTCLVGITYFLMYLPSYLLTWLAAALPQQT